MERVLEIEIGKKHCIAVCGELAMAEARGLL